MGLFILLRYTNYWGYVVSNELYYAINDELGGMCEEMIVAYITYRESHLSWTPPGSIGRLVGYHVIADSLPDKVCTPMWSFSLRNNCIAEVYFVTEDQVHYSTYSVFEEVSQKFKKTVSQWDM
jgi:hypothetical protein